MVSGIGIDSYSRGSAAYRAEARAAAVETYGTLQGAPSLTLAEVLAVAEREYSDKEIMSIALPEKGLAAYKVELSDSPAKVSNFALGEALYVGASDGGTRFVPAPSWLTVAPFFINVHIHNHDLLLERILWAALILLSAAMVVTGALLYFARPARLPGARGTLVQRSFPVKGELALLLLLPLVALILPIYGGWGDGLGLLAFALAIFAAVRLWRKGE